MKRVFFLCLLIIFAHSFFIKNDYEQNSINQEDSFMVVRYKPEQCQRTSKSGDTVSVEYESRIDHIRNPVHETSFENNQTIKFKLGSGDVIDAWDNGINNMCVGEQRVLTINPSHYGFATYPNLPANSTLIYKVELKSIE
eukprot:c12032_g1_i1.p1 GENE.c12032_g1_i1~~c12032_g1_i1.p1  ORF type:complete len:155 (-),score=53.02 c12032_g1_i1:31-450(-)